MKKQRVIHISYPAFLPKGTFIQRSDGAGWTSFCTTKNAIYENTDVKGVDFADDAVVFQLPKKAHPWIIIKVHTRDLSKYE